MSADEVAVDSTQISDKSLAATLADLHSRLDSLWISYLENLDQYTSSQKLIQKHISAGFLSLARANFNARNGLRRFGPESFHERAIACRRARVFVDKDDETLKVEITKWTGAQEPQKDSSDLHADAQAAEEGKTENTSSATVPSTTAESPNEKNTEGDQISKTFHQDTDSHTGDDDPSSSEPDSKLKSNLAMDPLRWFGILVPQELRSAQTSFISAAGDPISNSLNAARRMRELEVEIRKMRKEIRRAEKAF